MASFSIALDYANRLDEFALWLRKFRDRICVIAETQAFARFYLKRVSDMISILHHALKYKHDDGYYWKYLVLAYLITDHYEDALRSLWELYRLERMDRTKTIFLVLKSCYQIIMNWFKAGNFSNIIEQLIPERETDLIDMELLAKMNFDVGLAIVDQGFFDLSLQFFDKAKGLTHEHGNIASILTSMGSVKHDLQDFNAALALL